MKISIITATYNSSLVIKDCMSSVLKQNYQDIEYIIIDGASKDNTLDKIRETSKNHNYVKVVSEPDLGIYDALNKGVKLATGDIIGFVHSDDLLASNVVLQQIITVFKSTNSDGVYGDLQYVDKIDTNKVIRYWKSLKFTASLLKKGWMPAHPSLFLKREVYNTYGGFNLDFKIAADYDFVLRIFKDPDLKFTYLPLVITKMRVGGASNRNLKNIIKKSKEDYLAVKRNEVGGILTIIKKNTSKLSQFYKKKPNA